MKKGYYGHPSWKHWNVVTAVGDHTGLYEATQKDSMRQFVRDLTGQTLYGTKVTKTLARYAWKYWHDL